MPFYFRTGLGPLRYSHRIGGHHRRGPSRPLPPARPESPRAARARFAAGLVILSACAVLLIVAVAVSL